MVSRIRMARGAAAAAMMCGLLSACGGGDDTSKDGSFVIGVIEDRSGGSTFYSQAAVAALKAYVKSINAGENIYAADALGDSKGILDKAVSLVFEDDQNNPTNTPLKVRALISKGADAIMFTSGSSSTLQGRVVCQQEKIFCAAPTNVNGGIVEAPNNEFIFTAAPTSGLTAGAYIDAWKKAGYSNIAYFSENSATSQGLVDAYKSAAEKAGLKTVANESVEIGARDAVSQVSRIDKSGADVVFDATQAAAQSALLYKGLAQINSDIPRWANNAITAQPKMWEIVGKNVDGLRVVDPYSPENKNAKELAQLLTDHGVTSPVTFIQTTVWDSLLLMKKSFDDTKSADGAKAIASLEKITDFPSATGQDSFTYSFGPGKHNAGRADQNVVVEFADGKPSRLVDDLLPRP